MTFSHDTHEDCIDEVFDISGVIHCYDPGGQFRLEVEPRINHRSGRLIQAGYSRSQRGLP